MELEEHRSIVEIGLSIVEVRLEGGMPLRRGAGSNIVNNAARQGIGPVLREPKPIGS